MSAGSASADISPGAVVYLDSNILIYWIEQPDRFGSVIRELFNAFAASECRLVTSALTLAECIYKPAREGDDALVATYWSALVEHGEIELLEITTDLMVEAGRRGGALGLKLLDATHYVSALSAGAQLFVTGDADFRSTRELTVKLIA